MKTLILTDNTYALALANNLIQIYGGIDVFQSPTGALTNVPRLNVKTQVEEILTKYSVVISMHCKQLFPPRLVNTVRCVNVHPGFNPFNRGWFPQVFSIINGMKLGVTIHEIDEKLDHGRIIVQREYKIEPWDTSGSAYANIIKIERDLVLENFTSIRDGLYRAYPPQEEGNVNYKGDFEKLMRLDLSKHGRFGDFIDILRALTHEDCRNAYFITDRGEKVFVRVVLERELVVREM